MGVAVLRGMAVLAGYFTAAGHGPRWKTPFGYESPFFASLLASWEGSNRTGVGGYGGGDSLSVLSEREGAGHAHRAVRQAPHIA